MRRIRNIAHGQVVRLLVIFAWLQVHLALGVGCRAHPPSGVFVCQSSFDCPDAQRCYDGVCSEHIPITNQGELNNKTRAGEASTPTTIDGAGGAMGTAAAPSAGGAGVNVGAMGALDAGSVSHGGSANDPIAVGPRDASGASAPTTAGSDAGAGASGVGAVAEVAAGGSDKSDACSCSNTNSCCDGCQPRNEAGGCDSDDVPCTHDVCRAGQCAHELEPTMCLLDRSCYTVEQAHPTDSCRRCGTSGGVATWVDSDPGAPCDDRVYCNGGDTCGSGGCTVHTGDPCATADVCQRCDEATHACNPSGDATWVDEASQLQWPRTVNVSGMSWSEASATCAFLRLCGLDDWRLPTIDELRTLIDGCDATAPGGACGVTDSCASDACWRTDCMSCPTLTGGTYLTSSLERNDGITFSSTTRAGDITTVYTLYYPRASIQANDKTVLGDGRCVRSLP